MRVKTMLSAVAMAAAAVAFVAATMPRPAMAYESTWERIKRTRTLTQGCILQVPFWHKGTGSDEWRGWVIEATKQMAKDLEPIGVKEWRCEATGWGTAALGIQAGKMDYMFGMQATPLRATAITFAGPVYNLGFMMINSRNFKSETGTWADYDKPGVRIVLTAASSTSVVRRFVAPKATAVELPEAASVPMAVIAGRAEAMLAPVIMAVLAKQMNPDLGNFVIPTPLFSFPSYIGVANEDDKRFRDFMHWWAEWYRLQGKVEEWIKDSLVEMGIDRESLPDKMYF